MIANPPLHSLIYLYNHYTAMANRCWELYKDLADAYLMYDYYMEMAGIYEEGILRQL